MKLKTDTRIELKDVFRIRDKTYIEKKLILSGYGFYQPYPPRRINSLYFDTSDFVNMSDSIEGCSKRTKKRLRWYGNNANQYESNLEFKSKQGHFSWKKIFPKFCTFIHLLQIGMNFSTKANGRAYNQLALISKFYR